MLFYFMETIICLIKNKETLVLDSRKPFENESKSKSKYCYKQSITAK